MQTKYTIQQGKEKDRKQSNTMAMLNNPNIGFFCEKRLIFCRKELKAQCFFVGQNEHFKWFCFWVFYAQVRL